MIGAMREAIERFITHDLPEAIAEELARGALEGLFETRMFAPVEV